MDGELLHRVIERRRRRQEWEGRVWLHVCMSGREERLRVVRFDGCTMLIIVVAVAPHPPSTSMTLAAVTVASPSRYSPSSIGLRVIRRSFIERSETRLLSNVSRSTSLLLHVVLVVVMVRSSLVRLGVSTGWGTLRTSLPLVGSNCTNPCSASRTSTQMSELMHQLLDVEPFQLLGDYTSSNRAHTLLCP